MEGFVVKTQLFSIMSHQCFVLKVKIKLVNKVVAYYETKILANGDIWNIWKLVLLLPFTVFWWLPFEIVLCAFSLMRKIKSYINRFESYPCTQIRCEIPRSDAYVSSSARWVCTFVNSLSCHCLECRYFRLRGHLVSSCGSLLMVVDCFVTTERQLGVKYCYVG